MSRETSLIKKIGWLNEEDASHEEYTLAILCDIAESLAVIADKLTEEQEHAPIVFPEPRHIRRG